MRSYQKGQPCHDFFYLNYFLPGDIIDYPHESLLKLRIVEPLVQQ